jgi:hypothetical protein
LARRLWNGAEPGQRFDHHREWFDDRSLDLEVLDIGRVPLVVRCCTDKERPRVEDEDAPDLDFLPKICRQHSVTLQQEDDLRTSQGFQYKSDEWHAFHKHARNSIEGLNGNTKDDGQESIDSKSRRRVRGFAAASVFMAFLLTTFNLRTIATFIKKQAAAEEADKPRDPQDERKLRRRDWESMNDYTGTVPNDPVILRYHQGKLASPLRT